MKVYSKSVADHGFLPEYRFSLYNMWLKENAVFSNVKYVSGQKLYMETFVSLIFKEAEIFIFGLILVCLQR